MPQTRYVVITPARDEEQHLDAMVRSMVAQTILPLRWVIVNDGSSDRTGALAERYACEYPWITVLDRPNRGYRKNGGGVIETFYAGYEQLRGIPWEFIVKLDADLTFAPDYFERCFDEFKHDHSLGIGGGAIYNLVFGVQEFESHPRFHVRGATKIYRQECWDQIGGVWLGTGWDTIDEMKANMLGWSTRTFRDIRVVQHRMTGTAEGGWRDNFKNGRGSYAAGYHPLFVLVRCSRRIFRKPYGLGAVAMLCGFLSAYWRGLARHEDTQLMRYVRRQQLNRLLLRPSIWR